MSYEIFIIHVSTTSVSTIIYWGTVLPGVLFVTFECFLTQSISTGLKSLIPVIIKKKVQNIIKLGGGEDFA